jgi:predicted nucleic acid-binding protein
MKLFLDTNVMIDLIIKRIPFFDIAQIAFLAEKQKVKLASSSLSFVNTFYVASKTNDTKLVLETLKKVRFICEVSIIDEINIDKSLVSDFDDFEDAIQHYSALSHNCDYIITRDKKGFKNAEIPTLTPSEFLIFYNTTFS